MHQASKRQAAIMFLELLARKFVVIQQAGEEGGKKEEEGDKYERQTEQIVEDPGINRPE